MTTRPPPVPGDSVRGAAAEIVWLAGVALTAGACWWRGAGVEETAGIVASVAVLLGAWVAT